jgi:hypothetical protein
MLDNVYGLVDGRSTYLHFRLLIGLFVMLMIIN